MKIIPYIQYILARFFSILCSIYIRGKKRQRKTYDIFEKCTVYKTEDFLFSLKTDTRLVKAINSLYMRSFMYFTFQYCYDKDWLDYSCIIYIVYTLTRKNMNLPYSLRMYWTNFWQPTVFLRQNIFEINSYRSWQLTFFRCFWHLLRPHWPIIRSTMRL